MKRLDKLLLVNWHYLVCDVLDMEQVTFLTGKNGAGKSTILDALQMIILGDTSGHFFNKAANDNSRRTLKGYLYGEVAEGEETGAVYLRDGQTFASYVVAQFTDTVKEKSYCVGVVFDCEADGEYKYRFFALHDELPSFLFIREGTPLGIDELRQWGARLGKNKLELYETNKRYQAEFRILAGNVGEKFFRLFRKAVPFSPIMDVAGFISEFVCDVEHRLDIADMRENIRHYRRMEAELDHVRQKVTALERINAQAESLASVEERLLIYRYLLDRARLAELIQALQTIDAEIADTEERISNTALQVKQEEDLLQKLHSQRDAWRDERAHSNIYVTQQRLHSQQELLETRFSGLSQSLQRQERHLLQWRAHWSAAVESVKTAEQWSASNENSQPTSEPSGLVDRDLAALKDALLTARQTAVNALDLVRKPHESDRLRLLHTDTERFAVDLDRLREAQRLLYESTEQLRETHRIAQSMLSGWKQEARELETVIAELRRGVKPYGVSVTALRQAITAALTAPSGEQPNVTILADALDIPDPTWQPAIEGYLHTQRFYLLVAPEHFPAALRVYDAVKKEQKIYDVGLVDIGRILEQKTERMPGSLAEEVTTHDPYARAYVDFLLGRVMKCEQVGELREHRTAITKDGMLYQNFVARQLDPRRLSDLFIGKRALELQLEKKSARWSLLQEAIQDWTPRVHSLHSLARLEAPTVGELRDIEEAQAALVEVPDMQKELREVLNALGSLNLASLLALDEKITDCEKRIAAADNQRKALLKEQADAQSQQRFLQNERRPRTSAERDEAERKVSQSYSVSFADEIGDPRFSQELQRLGAPSVIVSNFGRQMQTDTNRRDTIWAELVSERSDFNKYFQMGFDIQRPDNAAYEQEYRRLVDSRLAEYDEKIRQAKERAQVQFQEDFISKLRSNIDIVERQIRELNAALRGVSFGRDQYRFDVKPHPAYHRFYQMIMDELLMEGYGLFSQSFQEKHGDVVEELFRQIVDVDAADALVMTELEKNLERFTDYRTYLQFDLLVKDEEGRESRLSRVIAKKSGGETQTPFYISVLASFVQLYRIGRQGSDNTLRLIVFDEAYSKMDHQRIRESVKLIRELGLQVILSAPTEKLADIAPLVDKTMIVSRVQSETRVLPFDFSRGGRRA